MTPNTRTAALAAAAVLVILGAAALTLWRGAPPAAGDKAAVEQIVRNYLLTHPEMLVEMQRALEAKQTAEEGKAREAGLAKVGVAALTDPKVAFSVGPENAKVTIVEFFDYRCPYCKSSQEALKTTMAKHPGVRFAFVEYPILSAESLVAARAAVAARRQPGKYVPFHHALMESTGGLPEARVLDIAKSVGIDVEQLKKDMADPSVMASLEASRTLADTLHINGTPTFVINDKFTVGQVTEAELTSLIKAAEG
jgi:protein-disulfide isomerase